MQGAFIGYQNFDCEDCLTLSMINPSGDTNPAAEAASGQADVNVGAYAPYYDPLNGAESIEFWNAANTQLLEVVRIDSRDGNVITLKNNLALTHGTSENIRVRIASYTRPRGTYGLDGGVKLIGDGTWNVYNEMAVTAAIPANIHVCLWLKTSSAATGTRKLAVTFTIRKNYTDTD